MIIQKKKLAARTMGVGLERIVFNKERLTDINEALTKQDIRDLVRDGAITVREVSGRKTQIKTRSRRREGSIRKSVKNGKREYILFIRRSRNYIAQLKKQGKATAEEAEVLRRAVRARKLQTKQQIRERLSIGGTK